MERKWAELEKLYDISPAQQHILFLLSTNKNQLTPTQLSELGCWHISTVTRLLKPLKANGFINVTTNKEKPRYKRVSLTAKGKQMLENLMDAARDLEQFPFDIGDLSEEEVEKFLKFGQSILDINKGDDFIKKVINARVEGYDYV
ncbi:MarR family winged helix-turn-helix transcriptional regulator [Aquibacillus albus]|nr:MarR family winged helix-turn-helix transcriptional regulator [Aquibacillus albus]